MSSDKQKFEAPRVELPRASYMFSLEDELVQRGVVPLNEKWVERGMLAASLGLPPDSWRWTVRRERKRRTPDTWKVFTYKEYADLTARLYESGKQPEFGTPMPYELLLRVEIAQRIPGVRVEVHALERDDPFVWAVRDDGQRKCIGAWWGTWPKYVRPE